MYNEEQKRRFIADMGFSESMLKFALQLFYSTEKYEEQWGKDICYATKEELAPVVNAISSMRSSAQHTRVNMLRKYVIWCKENGIQNVSDAVFIVAPDNTSKIRKQTVSGPIELSMFLDAIFPAVSAHSISILFRCYYWLAFSGVKEQDVFDVKKEDIDFGKMLIRFNGDEFPLYKESVETFHLAVNLKTFWYKHKTHKEAHEMQRIDSEYLLSATEGVIKPTYAKAFMYKQNLKALKNKTTAKDLSYIHVFLSGVFYRKYELERAIGEAFTYVDFLDVAEMASGDSWGNKLQKTKNRIARLYFEDYNVWKNVFNI